MGTFFFFSKQYRDLYVLYSYTPMNYKLSRNTENWNLNFTDRTEQSISSEWTLELACTNIF